MGLELGHIHYEQNINGASDLLGFWVSIVGNYKI
jgi:hypothetical protein